jgi:coenzyme F420-0:L-glutamate ligase/coenzyme F420-1:gamma-L-glutamate ligase
VAQLLANALPGLPEVHAGDDLGALIAAAAQRLEGGLADDDVLVVVHKVVSKAEGSVRALAEIAPGARARELAAEHDKDPRVVQVILDETAELVRADRGRLICLTRHGFVCANAGVDASNAGAPDSVVLLPRDPDASARALRKALRERLGVAPAVIVSDSFGRAWRRGQAETAIGCAGLEPLEGWHGRADSDGRPLLATAIAVADEAAGAADLVRGKDTREPAVRLRGLGRHVIAGDGPGVAALLRPAADDLFR